MVWTVFTDGGSRGNPGPAGAGVVIENEKREVVFEGGFFLGRKTNNEAEYQGLLNALDLLARAGAANISIATDSELMARHLNGEYQVKAPGLKPLYREAVRRLEGFAEWTIRHVRREQNSRADRLANRAMSARQDVVERDRLGLSPQAPVKRSRPVPATPAGGATAASAIEVRAIRGPARGVCAAGVRRDQSFLFTEVVPGGLCVHACSAVLEAVLALREAGRGSDDGSTPITVRCSHEACGAVFEIRFAEDG